ncbi:nanoRNase/pAp phosphatase (c-di-AMP/oligoRNAs hydrolase) [Natranaerovirga hydrolytica]|uniref:NanoRNase/pAp phosphatase (C-di-AMP/oligoRNAs hydrolase) n=1 Tax=Natranaerovirga hydrolytica TaxID=680378 RepID=A0A4R1MZG5_9FIRM|nr:DHH family phosphoesterase [Natranaerovirga hydrolytica]TCK98575.1 nanoRNase/pAp phosphatase (c-di-AMP/oligoRNAs hydrolase) [Natranaerovirga hydrolytica]
MLKLSSLLNYDEIYIQCHDNPDADSIASGFALYEYFRFYNKKVKLIYSGQFKITKPNLLEMISVLHIPIEYVGNLKTSGLLITVDCQYGGGNVKKLNSDHIAIIDHHQVEVRDISLTEIRPYLGSCSTLVWQLLREEDFDMSIYPNVSTALYYGLYSDTNNLSEISHPLDRDMRDHLYYDYNFIKKLTYSNLTLNDLEIAGIALIKSFHNPNNNFAIFKAHPCDPNILGFISDLALQVNTIDLCLVYNETLNGFKFSVRSCTNEIMAKEVAIFLTNEIGSGGGHLEKAGGFINHKQFASKYTALNIDTYFLNRIKDYFDLFEIIYGDTSCIDINTMDLYKKHKIPLGYIPTTKIAQEGTPIIIRTLEEDINISTSKDIYLLIDLKGNIHPINITNFDENYMPINQTYSLDVEYFPSVKIIHTNVIINLKKYAVSCIPKKNIFVYGKALTSNTKLFINNNDYKYITGKPGDYLVINKENENRTCSVLPSRDYTTHPNILLNNTDSLSNITIIEKEIFESTHTLISSLMC